MNLALLVLLATGVISKLDFNPPADEPIMVNHKNRPIWVYIRINQTKIVLINKIRINQKYLFTTLLLNAKNDR